MESAKSQKEKRIAILKQAFDRAKKQNEAFSLRALAGKLKISPAFLSKIMNGKSELPIERVADFVQCLKMDKSSESRLLKTYLHASMEDVTPGKPEETDPLDKYEELGDRSYGLLQHWYYIAILDSASLPGFSIEAADIAQKVGINKSQAEQAVRELIAEGYLIQDAKGKWIKKSFHFRFPTERSHQMIRAYHGQMIKKAGDYLQSHTSPEDFSQRLISGVSIAANSKNKAKAIARLNEAMYEVAQILAEGIPDEMYHLNVQLFPIAKK